MKSLKSLKDKASEKAQVLQKSNTDDTNASNEEKSVENDGSDASASGKLFKKAANAAQKPLDDYMEQLDLLKPLTDEAGFEFEETTLVLTYPPELGITLGSTENYAADIETKFAQFDKSKLRTSGKLLLSFLKRAHQARKSYKNKTYRLKSFTIILGLIPALELAICQRES